MTSDESTNAEVAMVAGLPATAAYDEVVWRHERGGSITAAEVLAKADAMRSELLAARYFYRNSAEARGKRIEKLEWMLHELVASSSARVVTADGRVGECSHDKVIDNLACRYELAHR